MSECLVRRDLHVARCDLRALTGAALGVLVIVSATTAQTPSPDNMVLVVPGYMATNDQTIGCCMYNPANNCFYAATFGTTRDFRKIDMNTNPPTSTLLCYTSDSQRFAVASNVPEGLTSNGDTGGGTPLNPSGMLVNTSTVTLTVPRPGFPGQTEQVVFPPGTLAFLTDNGATIFEGGSTVRHDWSKRLYRFDMREVWSPTSAQPDYANALDGSLPYPNLIGAYGQADWNDVFTVMVTQQNILDTLLPLTPRGSITFNLGRQGALSSDGKSLYYNDSADDFGGIWKVHVETGALEYFWNDRDDTNRVNTEPCVVHTSVRDLDPDNPAAGDQILFRGHSTNVGGVNYLIDAGGAALGPYVLWTQSTLAKWIEWHGSKWGVRSYTYNNADPIAADTGTNDLHDFAVDAMCADPDGTIYFHDGPNYHGLWRYDTQGRFGLIRSRYDHVAFNQATQGSTNISTLRMQPRTIQYTNANSQTFPVRQINFMAVNQKGIAGVNAFKTGDFNRDNVVDETDVQALLAAMETPIETVRTITLAASSWTCPVTLEDGVNTIEVQSVDRAGNTSDIVASTVHCSVDTTNPTVTIGSPTNGQNLGVWTVTVSGTASDPGAPSSGLAQVDVRVNSGAWRKATGTTSWNLLVGLSPGSNTIEARSRDFAGNYSSIASVTVTCTAPADVTAPTVVVSSPTNGQTITAWVATLSGTASDPGSSPSGVALVEARVNGGAWQAGSTTSGWASWTCSVQLFAGANLIEVRSRDYAGNDSSTASLNVTCSPTTADTTAPTVRIDSPTGGQGFVAGSLAVAGVAGDGASGVALVEVRVNAGSWSPATVTSTGGTTVNWSGAVTIALGGNTIEARSRDYAGNYSTIASVAVAGYDVDTTAPTVAISDPWNGATLASWSYTISGSAADAAGSNPSGVALVEARVNSGAWVAAATSTIWSTWNCPLTLTPGVNTIEARSRDYAGNYSSTASIVVSCSGPPEDLTPPTVTISSPANGSTQTSYTITVSGSSNDADESRSGVAIVQVSVNGGPWINAAVNTAVNTVKYYEAATDGAGNPLETASDKTAWVNYIKYDLNGSSLVTAKDKLILWRHLGYAPVDYDRDGDVDMVDFAHFQRCVTAPDRRQDDSFCGDAKLDVDDDVDEDDLAVFMGCAGGADVEADPACMDP